MYNINKLNEFKRGKDMADICDKADETSDTLMKHRLADIHQRSKRREIQPKGLCHYCDEPVHGDKLFCNKDCSEDWELTMKRGQ